MSAPASHEPVAAPTTASSSGPARERFRGRTVVVTGGAGGIGRAVCAGFAAEGATVAIVDLEPAAVDEVAAQLVAGHGGAARGYPVDVRDGAAVRSTFDQVHADLGGPHVLVCLAGGSLGTPKGTADVTPDDLDLVVDVNLKGTFYCCQAALPHLAGAPGGAIVTTSSIGGRQPSPVTGVPYAASKAAVVGLTKRLAREAGPLGVRVNAVAPGLFLTGRLQAMYDAMPETERAEVLDAIPLGRFPELHEIVDPILFLASADASYITGVVLDVNGGRFMPL